ncbi:hypothetical protein ACFLY6_01735, partial [Candidatus Dependentiae bacterium]
LIPRIKLSYYFSENNNFEAAERVLEETRNLFKKMDFPKPKSKIEQYYEEMITGRTPGRERVFERLFDWLNKRKAAHQLCTLQLQTS